MSAQSSRQFERLTPADGLPQSVATCVLQDSRGFLWVGTQDGLSRYDGNEFRVYLTDQDDSTSLSNGYVRTIFEDSREDLWIGTDRALDRLDRPTGRFVHYRLDSMGSTRPVNFRVIYEDARSDLWVGTSLGLYRLDHPTGKLVRYGAREENIYGIYEDEQGALCVAGFSGLKRLDRRTGQLKPIEIDVGAPRGSPAIYLRCTLKDHLGNLWVGTWGQGLIRLDLTSGELEHFLHDPEDPGSISGSMISALFEDREGRLWVGTENGGLNLYRHRTGRFEKFFNDPDDPKSIISDNISALYQDREGNLWIGAFGGLNRLDDRSVHFEQYRHDPLDPETLSANWVTALFGDSRGDLWIGTWGGGLNRLDTATRAIRHFQHDPQDTSSISGNVAFCIGEDRNGNLWIGTFGRGLNRWDRRTGRFDHFLFEEPSSDLTRRNTYNLIIRDRRGRIWTGRGGGIDCRDPATGKILYTWSSERESELAPYGVIDLLEDRQGVFWLAAHGLVRLDPNTGDTMRFIHDPHDPASIADNHVRALFEDRYGHIWAGTNSGLSRLDPATGQFENFGVKEGLIDNTVSAIVEDDLGFLWLNTDRALVRFDPGEKIFRTFDTGDGLPTEGLSMTSWKDSRTGKLFFGSINGVIALQPSDIVENDHIPPIVLTRLVRYNSREDLAGPIIDESIQEKEEVRLSFRDNVLEFEFAALNFIQPWKNSYAYRLEGFNDRWIPLGTENRVTFTNLDPGAYLLQVKGANNDGIWNESGSSLRIIIEPPWWRTWWAYGLYGAVFLGAFFWLIIFQVKRVREKEEARRILQLDAFKSRFYSNITHEFRTPLAIILGMADQLEPGGEPSSDALSYEEGLAMIRRNGRYLLHLIDQMLDLSRLEAGQFKLHPVKADLLAYLRYLLEPFTAYAAGKDIRLHLLTDLDTLTVDFDPDVIRDILSNLLSNAIKFTPGGGDVYVSVERTATSGALPSMSIKVKDTGIGIAENQLLHIFDRFYKVEGAGAGGTGVGLALTRELVQLAGGEIGVKSAPGKGTEFIVRLPVTGQAPSMIPEMEPEMKRPDPEAYSGGRQVSGPVDENAISDDPRPLLLIVEDNADVVQYLSTLLKADYRITVAVDGQQGIDQALEHIPDLVISDVMMPVKDGFEVCTALKEDERTSHIPIILLTARADVKSRLKGLESGADAYLVKPFNKAELEVRLRKLNERLQRLQARYGNFDPPGPAGDRTEQRQDAFLQKLNKILETHLDDEHFHIEDLCRAIHLSRSQLYRKINALTGRSASRYLRAFRLQKARQLLRDTDLNISEVALEVGYKDPSYFTRTFVEEFGYTPSAFRGKGGKS